MHKIQTTLDNVNSSISVPAGATHIEPSVFDRHICVKDKFDLSTPSHYVLDCILADQAIAKQQGKKHVVLMGEEHRTASNMALQSGIISLWSRHDSPDGQHDFMVADEVSYRTCAGQSSLIRAKFSAICSMNGIESPVASSSVRQTVAERGVNYFHVDAESREGWDGIACIDADDRVAQELYAASRNGFYFQDGELDAEESLGMALRNQVHVKLVDEHMGATGCKTACLLSGADHVYGHQEDGIWYKETLTHLFRQRGYYVTPVIIGADACEADYKFFESLDNRAATIVIDGLDEAVFDTSDKSRHRGHKHEKKYLEKLQQQFANANDGLLPFILPGNIKKASFYRDAEQYFSDKIERGENLNDADVQRLNDVWHGRIDLTSPGV